MLYFLLKNGEVAYPERVAMSKESALIIFENFRVRSVLYGDKYRYGEVNGVVTAEFMGDLYTLEPILSHANQNRKYSYDNSAKNN